MSPPESEQWEVRLFIDGGWTAFDAISFLRSLNDLYNFYCSAHADIADYLVSHFRFHLPGDDPEPDYLARLSQSARITRFYKEKDFHGQPLVPDWFVPLTITRERYSSPGFKDLAGFGVAVKHLLKAVTSVCEYIATAKKREQEVRKMTLENDELKEKLEQVRLETDKKKMELVAEFVKLVRDNPEMSDYWKGDRERSINSRIESLEWLAKDGKLTTQEIAPGGKRKRQGGDRRRRS
jgi:hypothetical protein